MLKIIKKFSIIFFILLMALTIGSVSAEDSCDINSNALDDNSSDETYAELFNQVNSTHDGDVLNLTKSYKYNSSSDESLLNGIPITKKITIVGTNNTYIDGNYLARGFFVDENCTLTLKNIVFRNCYSNSSGGAVFVSDNSNLIVYNCTFYNNKVYNSDGGAINSERGTNVEIHASEFYNNQAYRVSNLAWKDFKSGMGSAICVDIGSNLKIYDSIFRDHDAGLTVILVISYSDPDLVKRLSTLYVKNCLFENNVATTNGVIYSDELGTCQILDSVFRKNYSTKYGGIVALDTSYEAIVRNCVFEENVANYGAIYINSFQNNYRSHVFIENCDFKNNLALDKGGAIYSKYGIVKISNSNFYNNRAVRFGGAIYSKVGSISISNSKFYKNSAPEGGALYLLTEENKVVSTTFERNTASKVGGAIFSKMEKVTSSKCKYIKNSAPTAAKVYGAFYIKVYQYKLKSGTVKLKIKISSPWKMPISQKIKLKFKGKKTYTTKWLKTNSKGVLVIKVPKWVKLGKKSLTVTMKNGVGFVESWSKVKDPVKITYSKSVKKPNKLKVKIKNKAGKAIKNTKFKVKIYTDKKYKTVNVKTNSKGIFNIITKKLTEGTHQIVITLNNKDYYINEKISVKIL